MSAQSYAVIETPIGWIGIAWSAHGLTNLQLPERDKEGTRRRLLRRVPAALEARPQGAIAEAVALLERYAAGEEIDFGDVPLDLSGADPFRLAIYRAARRLGFGQTTTYGGLAESAGHPGEARETGQALGSNPVPIIVPCHRILAAGNKIGGFSAPGGARTKRRLLAMEGVSVDPPPPAQRAFAF
jgi:methylated-DNA-[protein]-cysteine S-methyltransferase